MKHLGFVLLAACAASTPAPAPAPAPKAPRFDEQVRQDFFDGMRGDKAAFDRAMKLCDDALAKNPRYPEAMVWHGAGQLFRSSTLFKDGHQQEGVQLFQQGLAEMEQAVELAPNNVGVRIPRGAVLLAVAQYTPDKQRTELLQKGTSDYEATLAVQSPYFAKLSLHSREQLLYGLTDAYAALGETEKSQAMFARMQREASGSELMERARARSQGQVVEGATPCQQCHAR
ncbi:MAG: hypothetical protein QM831_12840 [Kofleriaceae bacterium]